MANQSDIAAAALGERVGSSELDPHVAVTVADEPAPTSSGLRRAPVIADRYRLDRVIAEGGMGIVFEAWHLVLNQPVAVKIVRREFLHDADAVQSFMDEARALAELRGPSVAQVLDAGLQDGMPFIVMELLQGKDLRVVAHESGPMSVEKAARLVREAGLAAAEAHAKGIVHCDLKPENLFLTEVAPGEEHVKVIDFGVCTRTGAAGDEGTTDMGSPEYMAPEQLEPGRTVDGRADVWALGVVLYELVTGSRPFVGDDLEEIRAAVLFGTPTPMNDMGVVVPSGFQRLVSTCLQKSPEARFANANTLCEALLRYEGTVAPGPKPVSIEPVDPPRKAIPWQLSAAALSGMLFLAALVWRLAVVAPPESPTTDFADHDPAALPATTTERGSDRLQADDGAPSTRSAEDENLPEDRDDSTSSTEAADLSKRPNANASKMREDRTAVPPRPAQAVRAFPDVSARDLASAGYGLSEPSGKTAETDPDSSSNSGGRDTASTAENEPSDAPSGTTQ